MMTFYERETDTLIVRPLVPLRERTTYAVVITRKLLDLQGQPVGSPYPGVHHASQGAALAPLAATLLAGSAAAQNVLTVDDDPWHLNVIATRPGE